jgi:hypothetical protein
MIRGAQTFFRPLLVCLMALLAITQSHAALYGRDIHGHAVAVNDSQAVFVYDADANLTWLRDFAAGGSRNSADAHAWVDNLSMGGFTDWRLPRNAYPVLPGCAVTCFGEWKHLWNDELGNTTIGGSVYNTGPFLNLIPSTGYWLAESGTSGLFTSVFVPYTNMVLAAPISLPLPFAVVRDGDVLASVTPVPEPHVSWMALAAFLTLVTRMRFVRKPDSQSGLRA